MNIYSDILYIGRPTTITDTSVMKRIRIRDWEKGLGYILVLSKHLNRIPILEILIDTEMNQKMNIVSNICASFNVQVRYIHDTGTWIYKLSISDIKSYIPLCNTKEDIKSILLKKDLVLDMLSIPHLVKIAKAYKLHKECKDRSSIINAIRHHLYGYPSPDSWYHLIQKAKRKNIDYVYMSKKELIDILNK